MDNKQKKSKKVVAGILAGTMGITSISGMLPAVESGIFGVRTAEAAVSTETDITIFSLTEQTGPATINTSNHIVTIEVVSGTVVTALAPTINLSAGAKVLPLSAASQDFTAPVTYTVTAEDTTTTQAWTVIVVVNKAALTTAITVAETLKISKTVGTAVGNVPQAAQDAFQTAILAATTVKDTVDASQVQVDTAITALATATTTFNNAIIAAGDKVALSGLNVEAEALVEADYTPASWLAADIAGAILTAQVVEANANATQAEVDQAVEALRAAMESLVLMGDKTALSDLIIGAGALVEADYTPASWLAADIAGAILTAQVVEANANATQAEVDQAVEALRAAMESLVLMGDKTALSGLIAGAGALVEANYTPASWIVLTDAIAATQAVETNANATQAEVDQAVEALQAAIDYLVLMGDKVALSGLIAGAGALVEADYTPASWIVLTDAIAATQAVETNANATQAEVDQAVEALQAAIDYLVLMGDKVALSGLIAGAGALVEADYTPASWLAADIAGAILTAQVVEANANATQAEVDQAVEALRAAMESLVLMGDKTALSGLIAGAGALVEANYTPASWIVLTDAIAATQAVETNANATQAEVDQAVEALQAAI
ncbi:MAG: hypothetical protein ACYDG6_13260, partial [Thermincolia bacterium]